MSRRLVYPVWFLVLVVAVIVGFYLLRSEISTISQTLKEQEVRVLSLEKQYPQVAKYFQVVRALSDRAGAWLTAREIVEVSRVILEQCSLYADLGLTPSLIFAVIERESGFNPRAVSQADAYGLMQVLLPTAEQHLKELGYAVDYELLLDPVINVRVGIAELVRLRKYWLSEGVDSWLVTLTSYYWGVRATHFLLTKKSSVVPSLEYGRGVLSLSDKWKESGL